MGGAAHRAPLARRRAAAAGRLRRVFHEANVQGETVNRALLIPLSGLFAFSVGALVASCDTGPGGGDRWACATAFAGEAEGELFGESSRGRITAIAQLVSDREIDDVEVEEGEEVWIFDGEYIEEEGPLYDEDPEEADLGFLSVIDDDGSLIPIVEDAEHGSDFEVSGAIDLEGECDASGEFARGDDEGSWEMRP